MVFLPEPFLILILICLLLRHYYQYHFIYLPGNCYRFFHLLVLFFDEGFFYRYHLNRDLPYPMKFNYSRFLYLLMFVFFFHQINEAIRKDSCLKWFTSVLLNEIGIILFSSEPSTMSDLCDVMYIQRHFVTRSKIQDRCFQAARSKNTRVAWCHSSWKRH